MCVFYATADLRVGAMAFPRQRMQATRAPSAEYKSHKKNRSNLVTVAAGPEQTESRHPSETRGCFMFLQKTGLCCGMVPVVAERFVGVRLLDSVNFWG